MAQVQITNTFGADEPASHQGFQELLILSSDDFLITLMSIKRCLILLISAFFVLISVKKITVTKAQTFFFLLAFKRVPVDKIIFAARDKEKIRLKISFKYRKQLFQQFLSRQHYLCDFSSPSLFWDVTHLKKISINFSLSKNRCLSGLRVQNSCKRVYC